MKEPGPGSLNRSKESKAARQETRRKLTSPAVLVQVLALLVSGGLLAQVWQHLDQAALRQVFTRMTGRYVVLAFFAYGIAIWAGGLRWHSALHLIRSTVHFTASTRLFLVGHFLFVILFGAVGGDIARTALYCRWYQFPFAQILGAAPLDRLFASSGVLLVALTAWIASRGRIAPEVMRRLHWSGDGRSLGWGFAIAGIVSLIVIVAVVRRLAPATQQFVSTLKTGLRTARREPRVAILGMLGAVLSQGMLTAVFIGCFCSVTHQNWPWGKLLWTFPAITVLSCLPFTFAGAGVREVAATTLLGLYDVPASEAVAAALLTLLLKLGWALIGGLTWWRETWKLRKGQTLTSTISVVIPVLNEAENLQKHLPRLRTEPNVIEVIVVDGGSSDRTRDIAIAENCRVLSAEQGRGHQMRAGAAIAVGDIVLFLHADTVMDNGAGDAIVRCLRDSTVVAGGCWKRFEESPMVLRGSRVKCWVRLKLGGRIAGDQALFVRRRILKEIGGVPAVPLMEEFLLCSRLRAVGRLALADTGVTTSARRFRREGVLPLYLKMWWVTLLYRLGTPTDELRRLYNAKPTKTRATMPLK